MTFLESLLPEFDQEMAVTRRLLERVPSEKGEWKPHPRSFAFGHLAQLIARMPGWITNAVREDHLDLSSHPSYTFETTETLLAEFDRNVSEARTAIRSATEEQMADAWSLTQGEQLLFSAPREAVVRQNISHLVHHRGQLSVYLRLNDIPVPSIYGPSADEAWDPTP